MDAESWLANELASFGCAACGQAYGEGHIRLIAQREELFFVDLTCDHCGSQAVAIVTMVGSFRGTVERWTEDGMRADVWVRPLMSAATGAQVGRLDPEEVEIAETQLSLAAQAVVDGAAVTGGAVGADHGHHDLDQRQV